MEAFQKRLNILEKSHCDTLEIQTRHEHWWKATQAKLDQFQARLVEDQRARDVYQVSVRDQLAKSKGEHGGHIATMKERVDYIEALLGQSGDHNAKGFEVIKSAYTKLADEAEKMGERLGELERNLGNTHAELHGRLAEEQKTRLSHHTTMSTHHSGVTERVNQLEWQLSDTVGRMDKLNSQLHARLDAHHDSLRDHVSKETGLRDASHSSVQERVEYLQERVEYLGHLLGDTTAGGGRAAEGLRGGAVKERLPADSSHVSVMGRFAYLERGLNDHADRSTQGVAELAKRLSAFELQMTSHAASVDGLKQSNGALHIGHESHASRYDTLAAHVRQVEQAVTNLTQRSVRDMDTVQAGFEKLSHEVTEDRSAASQHRQAFDKAEEAAGRVRDSVGALARSLGEETAEIRLRLESDAHRRNQLQEQIQAEIRARDALERAMQHLLAKEATARQAMEGSLQEALQKSAKALQDKTAKALQELRDQLRAENEERRHHLAGHQELLRKEQSSRLALEDAMAHEKGERFRQNERILHQVQAMHRDMGGSVSPTRRDTQARFRPTETRLSAYDDAGDTQELGEPRDAPRETDGDLRGDLRSRYDSAGNATDVAAAELRLGLPARDHFAPPSRSASDLGFPPRMRAGGGGGGLGLGTLGALGR